MSVMRVSKGCIDILLTAAMWKDWRHDLQSTGPLAWESKNEDGTVARHVFDDWEPEPVGKMLDQANHAVYAGRYGTAEVRGEGPYRFTRVKSCNPATTDKALIPTLVASVDKEIKFYAYQTNEGRGWEESEPYAFCQALRQHVLSFLWEGVDSIPWGGDTAYYDRFARSGPRS
ncbi:hypothetical protein [Glycomyces buryatensis]|uniref:Uncharacterized protein n=1 Tax=Glycomyces buryatensis TaxID=2570927 RepID=A0A4S8Q5Q4_9ACTN|nr:hypothetical protein [Glycomyces buryatensis]THV39637.1 hypothetical protein FAB82_17360 [Glycomyces buryatensis]